MSPLAGWERQDRTSPLTGWGRQGRVSPLTGWGRPGGASAFTVSLPTAGSVPAGRPLGDAHSRPSRRRPSTRVGDSATSGIRPPSGRGRSAADGTSRSQTGQWQPATQRTTNRKWQHVGATWNIVITKTIIIVPQICIVIDMH